MPKKWIQCTGWSPTAVVTVLPLPRPWVCYGLDVAMNRLLTSGQAGDGGWHACLLAMVRLRACSRRAAVQGRTSVICQVRSTSATLQACATQPRGVNGGSPSKISLMLPMPWSARWWINGVK